MPAITDVARNSLYPALINLWVEDQVTRTYLSEIWGNDPAVAFLIGGGNEGVTAVLKDAEVREFANVFGVIDRDYRRSNRPDWVTPTKTFRRFILPVHEVENYLLDARALAASPLNNLHKSEIEIEAMMKDAAVKLCWWAACRDVVAELKSRFRASFVSDPPCSIQSHTEAKDHICNHEWFQKLAGEVNRSTETDIQRMLGDAHLKATRSLDDGTWQTDFAGKEILGVVGSRICDRVSLKRELLLSEFDQDLARSVGKWQREKKAVPSDLIALLQALENRIARPDPRPSP